MHWLFSLVLLAVMAAPSMGQVTFNCLQPDLTFNCATFIPAFCNSIGNSTIVQGDTISRCFNVPASGGQCDFIARNMLPNPSIPNVLNCGTALNTVAAGCISAPYMTNKLGWEWSDHWVKLQVLDGSQHWELFRSGILIKFA
ncbi:hypothetical protein B0H13DRAFT_1856378 [Mycena leptocephala]|nr:hypothetical protein B0H13DRAFT_1856378 [Mycena leptocephala]